MNRATWVWLAIGAGLLLLVGGGVATLAYWKRSANAAKYLPALNATEDAYDIPRDLLARLAYQESRFRDDIISGGLKSPAGAVGIMQIVPRWHPGVDPLKVYEAINYGGQYLSTLRRQFGTWALALAAYNTGPGNLNAHLRDPINNPLAQETINYVREILRDVPVEKSPV